MSNIRNIVMIYIRLNVDYQTFLFCVFVYVVGKLTPSLCLPVSLG